MKTYYSIFHWWKYSSWLLKSHYGKIILGKKSQNLNHTLSHFPQSPWVVPNQSIKSQKGCVWPSPPLQPPARQLPLNYFALVMQHIMSPTLPCTPAHSCIADWATPVLNLKQWLLHSASSGHYSNVTVTALFDLTLSESQTYSKTPLLSFLLTLPSETLPILSIFLFCLPLQILKARMDGVFVSFV